mmetsp:Transcript_25868/g.54671  ORF Transcript_25868/g.54671 Transcript_25868/m.54671 type:complete len:255 (-) Transcript_25868:10-774(-)
MRDGTVPFLDTNEASASTTRQPRGRGAAVSRGTARLRTVIMVIGVIILFSDHASASAWSRRIGIILGTTARNGDCGAVLLLRRSATHRSASSLLFLPPGSIQLHQIFINLKTYGIDHGEPGIENGGNIVLRFFCLGLRRARGGGVRGGGGLLLLLLLFFVLWCLICYAISCTNTWSDIWSAPSAGLAGWRNNLAIMCLVIVIIVGGGVFLYLSRANGARSAPFTDGTIIWGDISVDSNGRWGGHRRRRRDCCAL